MEAVSKMDKQSGHKAPGFQLKINLHIHHKKTSLRINNRQIFHVNLSVLFVYSVSIFCSVSFYRHAAISYIFCFLVSYCALHK